MSCEELQQEEIEVLQSIYDGDLCFKEVNGKTYQYKIGEDGKSKSFLVEIQWGDDYPNEMPTIHLDAFYNHHVLPEVKSAIVEKLAEQGEFLLGCAMCYTLFEWAKENADELLADQPASITQAQATTQGSKNETQAKEKVKKEQFTKAQKRKMFNRLDLKGELPRGYDWVDIVKHLSQTGKGNNDS